MCFSPEASFVSGAVLIGAGALTLTKVKHKSGLLLAAAPVFFGIQQLIEGLMWVSFDKPAVIPVLSFIYLLFAYVFWPIYVPLAVFLLEKNPRRRKILKVFLGLGVVVAMYLLYSILKFPVSAQIVCNSIAYLSFYYFMPLTGLLYFAATCGSCLASSSRIINMYGVLLFLSFLAAFAMFNATFGSAWCFFAAALSLIVYFYFSREG